MVTATQGNAILNSPPYTFNETQCLKIKFWSKAGLHVSLVNISGTYGLFESFIGDYGNAMHMIALDIPSGHYHISIGNAYQKSSSPAAGSYIRYFYTTAISSVQRSPGSCQEQGNNIYHYDHDP